MKARFQHQRLPTFIVIGTMKGGTTSLYYYLNEHPEVCMSRLKEPNFFILQKNYPRGIAWYTALFEGGTATACGEASPNYTKRHLFGGVAERMHALLPDLKLIYVLRDPLKRMVSHYVHNYAHGRESRSLADALKHVDGNNYILTSKYYYQLASYLRYYSEESILVLASEDLRNDTRSTLQRIFTFLGVDPSFETEVFERVFHASAAKKRRSVLDRHVSSGTLRRMLRPVLPASVTNAVPFERPSLDERTKHRLVEHLLPDVEQLRAYTGMRFSSWSL